MNLPKILVVMASLSLSGGLAAQEIVVFHRGDFRVLGPGQPQPAPPADSAQAGFLAAAAQEFASPDPFDARYPLINPPSWGRVVSPETKGELEVRRSFAHGLLFRLALDHLLPGHDYVLCINGRPNHPGNELLPEAVPGHPAEKYLDFHTVTTDDRGRYRAEFALYLRPGPYNVHFYVKDVADHKIVLYGLEYFDFDVL